MPKSPCLFAYHDDDDAVSTEPDPQSYSEATLKISRPSLRPLPLYLQGSFPSRFCCISFTMPLRPYTSYIIPKTPLNPRNMSAWDDQKCQKRGHRHHSARPLTVHLDHSQLLQLGQVLEGLISQQGRAQERHCVDPRALLCHDLSHTHMHIHVHTPLSFCCCHMIFVHLLLIFLNKPHVFCVCFFFFFCKMKI